MNSYPGIDTSGSSVVVLSGLTAEPILARQGCTPYGDFGVYAVGCADVDADGEIDLVVGEPGASTTTGSESGRVHVFVRGGSRRLAASLEGTEASALYGLSVAGVADINLDGYDDLAITDPVIACGGSGLGVVSALSVAECPLAPARFFPGSRLTGSIESQDDQDEAVFDAVKGTRITLRTFVSSGPLELRTELIDPDGAIVKSWRSGADRGRKKRLRLRKDGAYTLRVRGVNGTLGEYGIKTKRKFPASSHNRGVIRATRDDAESPTMTVRAVRGTLLEIVALPIENVPDCPEISLFSPEGSPINTTPFVDFSFFDPPPTYVYGIPLPASGKHRISVPRAGPGRSKARFVVRHLVPEGIELLEMD
ncbi:MAG: VCBS repeat-containing protein [Planctomycetota bacterium]